MTNDDDILDMQLLSRTYHFTGRADQLLERAEMND